MTQEKKFFSVKLYPVNRDLEKTWFIKYYVKDYKQGKLIPKKYKGILNLLPKKEDRILQANKYIEDFENNIPPIKTPGARKLEPIQAPVNFANTIQLFTTALKNIRWKVELITFRSYESKLRTFHAWMNEFGYSNLPIGQMNKQIAKSFLTYLKVEKEYTNTTYNHYKSCLSVLYDETADSIEELNTPNPFKLIKSLPEENNSFKNHPDWVLDLIKKNLKDFDIQLYLAATLIYSNAVRPTELRRLKLNDIDIQTRQLTIRKAVNRKSKKQRIVFLPETFVTVFTELNYNQYSNEDYLFGNNFCPGEKQISMNYFKNRFHQFRILYKIPHEYKLYGLKHTANRILALSGINPHLQMRHNGHSDLNMTNRYINDINIQELKQVLDALPSL